jgi:VIT1/CCC1 family predicted Fe2+/Mn2+ transporter
MYLPNIQFLPHNYTRLAGDGGTSAQDLDVSEEPKMPSVEHVEKHFTATAAVRDIVIGGADGLTVPFALAAGLTGALASTHIVVTAGLAEIAAGSIAMGLGGYLAAKTDSEHYSSELDREYRETVELPEIETEEVAKVFRDYGLTQEQMTPIVTAITSNQKKWVDFMMRFELGLEAPDPARAARSAATIAASYIAGGLVPLAPYILMHNIVDALWVSVGVTLLALLFFGAIKGHYTGVKPLRGGLQTVLVGGLAAAAAFGIARLITR